VRPAPRALRVATGALFVAPGVFKLVASLGPGLPHGAAGFAVLLAGRGMPAPHVMAWGVCGLEVVGGALLVANRGARAAAALLACDMAGAIALVGVPGAIGRPVMLAGHAVGAEPWRLPLEVGLLLAMGWIAGTRATLEVGRARWHAGATKEEAR
jgi:uncharacterized membrane protein YphA (DoxX/SURF4 family)